MDKKLYFSYENNLLKVFYYNKILGFDDKTIKLSGLKIIGEDLKIKQMDKYELFIKGIIKNIIIGENYELQD